MSKRSSFSLTNHTKWSTRDLRRLVAEIVRRQGAPRWPFAVIVNTGPITSSTWTARRQLLLDLPAMRQPTTGLRGAIHTARVKAGVARDTLSSATVAVFVACGLARLRDPRAAFDSKWYEFHRADEVYAWATSDFPIRRKAVKPPLAGAALATKKRDAAQAKAREWARKAKLAETKLKAWRSKVRYYEIKLAKAEQAGSATP